MKDDCPRCGGSFPAHAFNGHRCVGRGADRLDLADKIAAAAVKWDTLRQQAVALRDERNGYTCDNEPEQILHEGVMHTERVQDPCWKALYPPDGELAPLEDWCEPCKARDKIHREYRVAVGLRAGAIRSLQRLCAKATS